MRVNVSRKEILLLLLLLTCFTFFVQWSGAEQRSFFSLILAIHNDHTLRIDRYADLTPDKALYDGHYYCDKAPGLPLLGLPVYALFNAMQNLNREGLFLPYSIYMVSAVVVSLPAALLALLVLRFLRRLGFSEGAAYAVTLAMALGTLALPFSTLFFSHQTAAFFGFAAFYTLYCAPGTAPRAWLILAGLLAGAAVLVEYPMAIMALLLLLYAGRREGQRGQALYYVLGGIGPALLLMAYNTAAFDHPLHFSYFYEANSWAQVHQTGFLGLGMPTIATFLDVILGARGLFTLSPVLLIAMAGFWPMFRERTQRAEAALFLAAFAIYLLMTSGYKVPPTDIWTPGPRFLVPVLPFLAAPLAFGLKRAWPLFVPLALASVAIMFIITAANPQVPPEIANPLPDYWLPAFLGREQLVHTLPELRFGISKGFSLLFLAGAWATAAGGALVLWLLRSRPRLQSAAYGLVAAAMLAAYLVTAFPVDLRRPLDVPLSLTAQQAPPETTLADAAAHGAQP